MRLTATRSARADHGRLPVLGDLTARRSPGAHRVLLEQRFRHTAWIERKPGAMWDAVPAAPRAAAAR
ncbi:hypothetical protein A8924_1444 [Saccharopolyspora erythraea NRRL 2338]|nr:hypothetical protein [Saccharopolyspora erythraea]EQD85126.1 hypothetical protein N599_16520 [Saccharopolyspora erythraea D]PFG94177.1 hypothetical protein A8924_1444 [Saccharopolyspora erythraea NRRL 2338]QRK90958.1 hypothetical protein JQX30_05765 [Saccharopolyspora erythraea]